MNNILIKNGVEIYKNHNIETSINVFNDELKQLDISNITYYKLKGKFNDKYVTLVTENIDDEQKLLDILISKSEIIDNDDDGSFAMESIASDRKLLSEDNNDEIIMFLKSLYTLKNKYKDIYTINGYYNRTDSDISIENNNVKSIDKKTNYNFYFEIVVKNNDKVYDDFLNIVDINLDLDSVYEKVVECIESIYLRYNSVTIKSGEYNVLLTAEVVSKILNQFSGMFDARNIKDLLSPLSSKFNEVVFSNKITFIEDPSDDKLYGSRLFDSEGTKTFRKVIVEKGKFISKLYDNATAKLDNVKSTGNSFGVRNLYIEPGNKSFDELENMLNDGIVITNVEGMHSGISVKSGDISLQARGYIIQNGKKRSVELIILSTNLFKMLNNVIAIENKLYCYNSKMINPSLLLQNIYVTVA